MSQFLVSCVLFLLGIFTGSFITASNLEKSTDVTPDESNIIHIVEKKEISENKFCQTVTLASLEKMKAEDKTYEMYKNENSEDWTLCSKVKEGK